MSQGLPPWAPDREEGKRGAAGQGSAPGTLTGMEPCCCGNTLYLPYRDQRTRCV